MKAVPRARGGYDPSGSRHFRRHSRNQEDRRHGAGARRRHGDALCRVSPYPSWPTCTARPPPRTSSSGESCGGRAVVERPGDGIEKPIVKSGFIPVPENPGLGVTLNEEVVKQHIGRLAISNLRRSGTTNAPGTASGARGIKISAQSRCCQTPTWDELRKNAVEPTSAFFFDRPRPDRCDYHRVVRDVRRAPEPTERITIEPGKLRRRFRTRNRASVGDGECHAPNDERERRTTSR